VNRPNRPNPNHAAIGQRLGLIFDLGWERAHVTAFNLPAGAGLSIVVTDPVDPTITFRGTRNIRLNGRRVVAVDPALGA